MTLTIIRVLFFFNLELNFVYNRIMQTFLYIIKSDQHYLLNQFYVHENIINNKNLGMLA